MCYDPAREELEAEHNAKFDYIAELRAEHAEDPAALDDEFEHLNAIGEFQNDADAIREFVMGGRAVFTLVSKKTGTRYTFRVTRAKDNPQMFFVGTLTGPDNGADYTYLGFFKGIKGTATDGVQKFSNDTRTGDIMLAGKKGDARDVRFRGLNYLFLRLARGEVPADVEFWHEGRCGRCARALTDPASIRAGFGPECRKHV